VFQSSLQAGGNLNGNYPNKHHSESNSEYYNYPVANEEDHFSLDDDDSSNNSSSSMNTLF